MGHLTLQAAQCCLSADHSVPGSSVNVDGAPSSFRRLASVQSPVRVNANRMMSASGTKTGSTGAASARQRWSQIQGQWTRYCSIKSKYVAPKPTQADSATHHQEESIAANGRNQSRYQGRNHQVLKVR